VSVEARALYFTEPGKVELREELLEGGTSRVLVRSRLIGISHGTEMLAFRGQLPQQMEADASLPTLTGTLAYPLKYGYINVGQTEEGRRVFAFYPHQDLFFMDPEQLIELPDGLEYEDGLFLASMETALGIVHDAHPRFGESVLLVGQGTVGLLVAEILARAGVGELFTVEPSPTRRRASEAIGCLALSPEQEPLREVRERTGGRGVDVAVNVSASEEGLQLAIDALAFEGTVVEASWYGTRKVALDLGSAFHRKRLRLRGSQVSSLNPALTGRWNKHRRLERVLELLASVRPARYITHRFALSRAREAYELLDSRPEGSIQVVLEP
jgi:2-desacetyl-2-hydroxyethyl bacteriochlorophyllide A dehydrogenase